MWERRSGTFRVRAGGREGAVRMLMFLFLWAAPASEQGFGSSFQQACWWEPHIGSPASRKQVFLSLGTSRRQQNVGVGHILVHGAWGEHPRGSTCAGTSGCGRRAEKQHDIARSPGCPWCKAFRKCRKEQSSWSTAIFVMPYWFLIHFMAIFKATIPQTPQLCIAILARGPVDFGWAPSMSKGCGDQLNTLPLTLQNTATGRSNTSLQQPHFVEKLAKSCLPGGTYHAQTISTSASWSSFLLFHFAVCHLSRTE